jgi:hypothetical protein
MKVPAVKLVEFYIIVNNVRFPCRIMYHLTVRCYVMSIMSGYACMYLLRQTFIQGVLNKALQLYSKCYCGASITKTLTLKGVQTIRCSK